MKNTLEGMSHSINEAEEHSHELEDRMVEITAAEQRMRGNEGSLRDRPLGQQQKNTPTHSYFRGLRGE